jgi:predicted transcriptional regulator
VTKMGKHRSRLKILANILSVVNSSNGAKKTQIMYQAYLSYKLLVQYLNDITDAGLVKCTDGNCYVLTQKGKNFLAKFGEYSKSRETVEKQLDSINHQKSTLEEMASNTDADDELNELKKQSDVQLKRSKII